MNTRREFMASVAALAAFPGLPSVPRPETRDWTGVPDHVRSFLERFMDCRWPGVQWSIATDIQQKRVEVMAFRDDGSKADGWAFIEWP